ncbi:hypothetical protein BESB_055660 [Besnoitia besnoiti]|uniref:Uncharacterized protein n=1 Tax=Besnoitia besnoiti TaxID=94643 RepID=A0A2A9MD47_BESBE|nr:hypothetical protein BESB_055660 [Besnoitia besnoiti]PFH35915.1 hypothetical protein BESB_055660 [Besnoitia besnoiti]
MDVLPNDFGPAEVNPLEPTAPEVIPASSFQGPVPLGNSIEQLLREPARFGSSEFYTKQKMVTYLNRYRAQKLHTEEVEDEAATTARSRQEEKNAPGATDGEKCRDCISFVAGRRC